MMSEKLDRETLQREVQRAYEQNIVADPRELLRFTHELLGEGLMMSTAFGKSGMVILDMVKDICPELPIYFVDTGFHFPETLDFVGRVEREMGLQIRIQRPVLAVEEFKEKFGDKLYETDPDRCCHKNKVEPFAALLDLYQGWITGIRRDQSATRAEAEPLEILESNQLKVQPLVLWTRDRVEAYLKENRVPQHPLLSQGYASIGCAPCTLPTGNSSDERAGRWAGKEKTECGLHLFRKKAKTPGA